MVKPGGAIILPVYPEGQAAEKGYWSRSFLENVFLSRTRWRGFSNITAENDGVMSLRVGRKWPDPLPSTVEWFYRQRCSLMLTSLITKNGSIDAAAHIQNRFVDLCRIIWQEYSRSAVIERVIIDYLGSDAVVSVLHMGSDHGLLVNDLMLSRYINVEQGHTRHVGNIDHALMTSIGQYFAPLTDTRHTVTECSEFVDLPEITAQVTVLGDAFTSMSEADYGTVLERIWARMPANGVLVAYEDLSSQPDNTSRLDQLLSELGTISYYSLIAGCKIKSEYEISQYSLAVEENLRQEKKNKTRVIRVLQKN